MNNRNVFSANMLQIDVRRDAFDRQPRIPAGRGFEEDNLVRAFVVVANQLLTTLRSLTSVGTVKLIAATPNFWRVDFLEDDGAPLPQDNVNIRRWMLSAIRWQACGITSAVWGAIPALTSRSPAPWEMLIIDSEAALPDIGSALVLAAAALETLIATALDTLAHAAIPSDLWQWLNNRGDYRKEPSVEEQYDVLLRILAGRSLKDNMGLWEALKQIRAARNSFMHEGLSVLGKKKIPVTVEQAQELINRAKEIAFGVESALPPNARRPQMPELVHAEVFKPLEAPGERSPG